VHISAGAAYLTTDILADNTDPDRNPLWGPRFQLRTDDGRRPATLKTGTTTDFKDLQAFGYLAADADPELDEGAIVTGVWIGNSDFSHRLVFARTAHLIWHDYGRGHRAQCPAHRDFVRPSSPSEIDGSRARPRATHPDHDRAVHGQRPNVDTDDRTRLAIEAATGRIGSRLRRLRACHRSAATQPAGSPSRPAPLRRSSSIWSVGTSQPVGGVEPGVDRRDARH
jgi:membrane peptidoglycan carboxypeptidase